MKKKVTYKLEQTKSIIVEVETEEQVYTAISMSLHEMQDEARTGNQRIKS